MATPSAHTLQRAGQDWLLSCVPNPQDVQRAWDDGECADLTTGVHWLVAEAPLTPSLQAIHRIPADRLGPVLADIHSSTAWWLLPTTLADDLDDLRQITVHPPGWILKSPSVLRSVRHRWWVELPDGTGRLTDPTLLGAAFSPGSHSLPAETPA